VNLNNRSADGLFIYNCHRLIKMYEHTKQQIKEVSYRGIVALIDLPRMVLEPSQNKQCFLDPKDEQHLKIEISNFMDMYVKELLMNDIFLNLAFWKPFGYVDMDFRFLPSDDLEYKRKRVQKMGPFTVQCNKEECLKWRFMPFNRRFLAESFPPDNWECTDNIDFGQDR
jgi:hypothetical protein